MVNLRRLWPLSSLVLACEPAPDDAPWFVDAPRILAVSSEPAEAPPGSAVQLTAFALGPAGPIAAPVRWGRCLQRKPLTELGPADPGCLLQRPGAWDFLGEGPSVSFSVPADACRLFGPERPEPKPGEPAGRPVDPDPSGGYYAPVALSFEGASALASVRLPCGLSGASQQAVITFGKQFRPNQNPAIRALRFFFNGATTEAPEQGDALPVPRGTSVVVSAWWDECPEVPACGDGVCSPEEEVSACAEDCQPLRGCSGAERYALYNPATQMVGLQREVLRSSWYATGGSLAEGTTAGLDHATNAWQAPSTPGEVWVAVVLRDDRGGSAVRATKLRIE